MTAKEYLSQLKERQDKIQEKEEYIELLISSLGIAGIDYSKDRVQVSCEGDKLGEVFAKIQIAETELKKMKEELVLLRVQIIDLIQALPEKKHRDILNHVYVEGLSLKDCASAVGFSYDYVRELHSVALQVFDEIFPHQFC